MSVIEAIPTFARHHFLFAIGLLIGLIAPLALGEAYIRFRPPLDLQSYLGDSSPLTGIYKPDPDLGADYRSIDDYRPDEAPRFSEIRPLNTSNPTWLFFGNSFAGNLSYAAADQLPSYRVMFFREPKDRLHMRIAQARMLLAHGLKPERMIFTLIPLEIGVYAQLPLSSIYVSRNGVITYRVRMPHAPWNWVLTHSRLALMAWVRSGLYWAIPGFQAWWITETFPDSVSKDFQHLFGKLGELSRQYGVPVTVIILPDRRQILNGSSKFIMQKIIADLGHEAGLDVYDPSPTMLSYPDKRSLYVPDGHYTKLGYNLVIKDLLDHLKQIGAAENVAPSKTLQ